MRNPRLTIITPVYNGQKFIESCLKSVIDQRCEEMEHLIVDGGSTDQTMEIVKQYARQYEHIRWISEKDQGQSSAMNKGISLAGGNIIGFLNGDDYYEPGVFQRILNIFEILPSHSFLVGNCNVLDDQEKVIYLNKPARLSLTNMLIGGEKNQFPFNPSSYFYHKSIHEKVGLYDESNHYTMDIDFLLRMAQKASIRYVDQTWGNFRYIPGTKTFQSKESNQLELNKTYVMSTYFKKLSFFQRGWIKTMRFFGVERKPQYYLNRVTDCLKNPQEINRIIARKLKISPVMERRNNRISAYMTQR